MSLRIKNWGSFQHYKDRCPPWIKLHKSLLDDFDYQCLPIASKALAPMLWLLASENMGGEIDSDVKRLAFRLRWPVDDVVDGLKPLLDKGFVVSDSNSLADCYQDACPETETETETETSFVVSKLTPCPHQEIISIYSEELSELPQPRIWEGKRQSNLANRWKWVMAQAAKEGQEASKEYGLDFMRRLFAYISKSDFLMGRSGNWNCDLGWIVNPSNFAKILDGNYENKVAA